MSSKLGDIDTRLLSDNDVIAMKKLYFGKVSTTIGKWIENNANLEYKFWISDAEVPRNPQVEVGYQGPFFLFAQINFKLKFSTS